MLEILGKSVIRLIEKKVVEAAPHIEQLFLEKVGSLAELLMNYINGKAESIAVSEKAKITEEKHQE